MRGSLSFHDPDEQFLQKWNKIFLFSCVFALAWDPLFLYIPVIDSNKKCLKFDATLGVIACVLRTIWDFFYLLHIIIQFRTGIIFLTSSSYGRSELNEGPVARAKRYLFSYFFVDVLAVLPLPQVAVLYIIPRLQGPLTSTSLLGIMVFSQYALRLFRIYPLYKKVRRTLGMITETAWGGAAFNFFLYMLVSHIIGAALYFFAIDQQDKCWHKSCERARCNLLSFYCKDKQGNFTFNETYCALVDPDQITDSNVFNFGIFYDVLRLNVVESDGFLKKFSHCFCWGLQNLSSLGQGLRIGTSVGENLFVGFICVLGLVLLSLLIGNMQKYLQSTTVRVEEMRVRRQDAEQWMSRRLLPEELRKRIRRYEQCKWQETRGVDEETLIRDLSDDLKRDIKRHFCLNFVRRVPMFEQLDQNLKEALCDRMKPVLYTENSIIVREGDPVNEMLFIMRGKLESFTTDSGRTGFFSSFLKAGDFCGDELFTWALDLSSSNLPISTRNVKTHTYVEAFALMPDQLKSVASQIRQLHSEQVLHTFRFYSQQWRTWAARFIQAAWRRYCRRKVKKSLREAEDRLQNALANEGVGTPSLGDTIYASRFAVSALRMLRQNNSRNARRSQRLPPMLPLQKPTEPDFASEDG